eukprot:2942037-Pyramimonas_sp.AAC.1
MFRLVSIRSCPRSSLAPAFHVSCRLTDCCRRVGVPVFLEDLDISSMWAAPRMPHDEPEACSRLFRSPFASMSVCNRVEASL